MEKNIQRKIPKKISVFFLDGCSLGILRAEANKDDFFFNLVVGKHMDKVEP